MNKLVILLAAFVFVACSSKPKTDEATAATSDVENKVLEATDTTTSTTTAETPTKTKKMSKEEVTTSPSATSDFPSITGTEKSSVTCTNKSDSRKISVLSVTEGGCGVVYNKMGEDKTVALAKVDMSYCDTVSGKIKTNLEGAGFNCGGDTATAPAAGTSTDDAATKQ